LYPPRARSCLCEGYTPLRPNTGYNCLATSRRTPARQLNFFGATNPRRRWPCRSESVQLPLPSAQRPMRPSTYSSRQALSRQELACRADITLGQQLLWLLLPCWSGKGHSAILGRKQLQLHKANRALHKRAATKDRQSSTLGITQHRRGRELWHTTLRTHPSPCLQQGGLLTSHWLR
jgi:hypothetical protein